MDFCNRSVRLVAGLLVPSLVVMACGGTESAPYETIKSTSQAVSADGGADAGLITISGNVSDPIDGPQAGITITLAGSEGAQVVTSFSGTYSFTVKPGGSYSVTASGTPNFFQAPFSTCLTITPSIVNLNNLTASTTIDFVGSGTDPVTNCSPAASTGAASGAFTLSGTVTSKGLPVPGVRVFLNGNAQGYRTTDETGAYSFSVNAGSYSVDVSGACASFTPQVSNINNVKANTKQNFSGTSCPPAPLEYCPTFDQLFGLSEPATCNTVSTLSCDSDRIFSWAGDIVNNYFNLIAGGPPGGDCRVGAWLIPPIANDFTSVGPSQQDVALNLFALQLFGCAFQGNLDGPLSLSTSLVPPDLIRAGLTFTTADLAALTSDYIAAINLTLSQNGSPALTTVQTTAIAAQLNYAASTFPGVVSSSKLSFSTCP